MLRTAPAETQRAVLLGPAAPLARNRRDNAAELGQCSHTPDTMRPMAKPEKPLTKPPTRAARAKRPKTNPSIESLPERGGEHLDGMPIYTGGSVDPLSRRYRARSDEATSILKPTCEVA